MHIRHLRTITQPRAAQLEQLTQIVALVNAVLGTLMSALRLTQDYLDFIGLDPPQKDTGAG